MPKKFYYFFINRIWDFCDNNLIKNDDIYVIIFSKCAILL